MREQTHFNFTSLDKKRGHIKTTVQSNFMQGTANKYAEGGFALPLSKANQPLSKEEYSNRRCYVAKSFSGQDYRARGGCPPAGATHYGEWLWIIKSCWTQVGLYSIDNHKGLGSPVSRLTAGSQVICYFYCVPAPGSIKIK